MKKLEGRNISFWLFRTFLNFTYVGARVDVDDELGDEVELEDVELEDGTGAATGLAAGTTFGLGLQHFLQQQQKISNKSKARPTTPNTTPSAIFISGAR